MTRLFGISQGLIPTNIGTIVPTIWKCLPVLRDVYKKVRKCPTIEDLNEIFPRLVVLTDASEQPIRQSKQPNMKESHYSAKAKTHTVKVQYAMSFDGFIVHKTVHSLGRRRNFKIYRTKRPKFPGGLQCGNEENLGRFRRDNLRHYSDTAYVSMDKAVSGLDCVTLFKRKPGKDLTYEQRTYERAHSRIRIRVKNSTRRGLPDHEGEVQE